MRRITLEEFENMTDKNYVFSMKVCWWRDTLYAVTLEDQKVGVSIKFAKMIDEVMDRRGSRRVSCSYIPKHYNETYMRSLVGAIRSDEKKQHLNGGGGETEIYVFESIDEVERYKSLTN